MSKPTPTTLREILEHWLPGYKNGSQGEFYTVNQATQSIQEQLKALLPEKIDENFDDKLEYISDWKYYDKYSANAKDFVTGYNQSIDELEKAIDDFCSGKGKE